MKTKYLLLTVSLLSFAIGFSDLQENIIFWLGRPVGAIAMIAYFILVLLEKEYALFDEGDGAKVKGLPEARRANKVRPESGKAVLTLSGMR